MISLDEFIKKYIGGSWGYPDNNSYRGECLSATKLYIKECFGINPPASGTNSAYGYWSNFPSPLDTAFDRVLNTTDLIPEYGWIAVWNPWSGNTYGHIAIVDRGCTKSVLKNLAQNWSSKKFQAESQNYTNVIGFLVPKINSSDNNMDITDEQKRVLEKLETYKNEAKHSSLEGALDVLLGNVTELRNSRETVSNLKKDLENCQKENDTLRKLSTNLSEMVDDLTDKLAEEQKMTSNQQKDIKSANKEIDSLKSQIEILTKERNDYKKWYEAKCVELKNLDKMSALEHLKQAFRLLVKKNK